MESVIASSLLMLLHRIKLESPGGGDVTLMGEHDAKLAADLAVLERHGLISTAECRRICRWGHFGTSRRR